MASDKHERQDTYAVLTLLIQALVVVGLILFLFRRDLENVFLTVLVLLLTLVPAFLFRRYRVYIPPEFQLVSAVFIFLSVFLGSVADFYDHFWWWDIVLHTGSGFLLGIIGFLVLFLMNQTDRLPEGIRPSFLCFFGLTFAVFLGVLWEIFEFAVDMIVPGANMLSWETGAGDTIVDLIVDTVGAILVALMGWAYIKTGQYSFIADAVRKFIRKNPRFFRKFGETTRGK
jgi:hypothetical protein